MKPKRTHTSPLLSDLYRLRITQHIQFKTLFLTYKALHNKCPQYHQTCCTFAFTIIQHLHLTPDYSSHTQNKQKRWWPFICCYSTKIMAFIAWSHSCCRHHWTIQKTVEISLVHLVVLFYACSPGCSLLHVFALSVCALHPWEKALYKCLFFY